MNLVTITASGVLALGLPFATPWLLQEPVPSSASTAPTTIDLSSLRGAFAQPATPAAPTSIATTANTSPVAPAAPPMVATFGAPPLVIDTRALLAPASMPGQEHHDDATIAQLAELQARIAALQAEMAELSAQRSSAGGPPLDTWPGALPRVDESEMDVEWIVDSQVEREPDVDPWPMIEQQLRRQRLAELQEHALGAAGAAAEQQRAEAQRAVAEARAQLESHGDELRARALELRELARHQAQGEREAARARNEGRRSQLLAELAQLDARMQQSNGAVEELYARLDVETEERVQAQLEARVAELEARMETLDWQIEARSDELELLDEQAYAFDSEFEGPSEWDLDTDWEFDTAGMLPDERRWAAAMDGLFAATELVDRHAGRFPGGAAGGAAGGACDEPAAVAGQPLWLDLRQPGPDTRPAATAAEAAAREPTPRSSASCARSATRCAACAPTCATCTAGRCRPHRVDRAPISATCRTRRPAPAWPPAADSAEEPNRSASPRRSRRRRTIYRRSGTRTAMLPPPRRVVIRTRCRASRSAHRERSASRRR
jgi:hypothetical protein